MNKSNELSNSAVAEGGSAASGGSWWSSPPNAARTRSSDGFRRLAVVALLLLSAGYVDAARADETSDATDTTEPSEDRGKWWDWIIGTMGDEGGSMDPESGTQ